MTPQPEPVIVLDEVTLRGMQAQLTADLAALFHGHPSNAQRLRLHEWLDSIQPPETIARLAGAAAAAVLVAFERGYRMSDADDRAVSDELPHQDSA